LKKEKYIIGYYPYHEGKDHYMRTVAEETTAAGYPVIDLMKAVKHPSIYKQLKVVNLNWFESVNKGKKGLRMYLNFVKRILMLVFFRITGKKIVFTFHNAFPHGLKNLHLSDAMIYLLSKWSVKIVALCDYSQCLLKKYIPEEELKKKMTVIPIASYKGCYPEENIDFRSQWGVESDACVITFVGSIQPYKNIEMIIESAKRHPEIYFVLAGKFYGSNDYQQQIDKLSQGCHNIIRMFRYIEDRELPALIRSSSFIITPYDKSSLNSGVVILAFSYGRTVICPEIGTIKQMRDLTHVYSYCYNDEKDHQIKLNEAIDMAYNDFLQFPSKVEDNNRWVEEYVNTENSRTMVKKRYGDLYWQILNG